ncbi:MULTISPECIES: response regulator transcription factor [Actinomadura]|uniref:Response regulator n=1 Tax=Actinomadura yumaensis TaxID=111807 RepID=A0ABW2CPM5_9ACTN|nr:response regulator transcription factor [Actinomadura sp. J1-007]
MAISVLLVDDHALVRTGFRMIIGAQPDMDVVGEAADGAQAVERAAELCPDVVLMDIHMPGLDGVAATERIMAARSAARVLALSTFDLDAYVLGALRAGAAGFLPKDVSPEELVEAIRVVHRGEAAVAPRLLTRLISTFVRASAPAPGGAGRGRADLRALTDREREVLVLIARGRSNVEIAAALAITASTVKNHVTSVFAKTGVRDRAQAVIAAYEAGLVTPGGD